MDTPHVALPLRIDVAPEEIRRRLRDRLLPVRSVWFPTQKELAAWRTSGHPLYVRFLGPTKAEIGPRLETMWASCFSPVDVIRFDGAVVVHRRFPQMTRGIVAVWCLCTVVWGASGLPRVWSGDEPMAWLAFWAIVAGASTLGPLVGWVMGGRALNDAQAQLVEAFTLPPVDEDW